ncbi:hypothetical protein K439DRAFT_904025 [Ramaria rubella]|nr:hypothetical protein K439DRAFT_904025 [Ramaria rubella]
MKMCGPACCAKCSLLALAVSRWRSLVRGWQHVRGTGYKARYAFCFVLFHRPSRNEDRPPVRAACCCFSCSWRWRLRARSSCRPGFFLDFLVVAGEGFGGAVRGVARGGFGGAAGGTAGGFGRAVGRAFEGAVGGFTCSAGISPRPSSRTRSLCLRLRTLSNCLAPSAALDTTGWCSMNAHAAHVRCSTRVAVLLSVRVTLRVCASMFLALLSPLLLPLWGVLRLPLCVVRTDRTLTGAWPHCVHVRGVSGAPPLWRA